MSGPQDVLGPLRLRPKNDRMAIFMDERIPTTLEEGEKMREVYAAAKKRLRERFPNLDAAIAESLRTGSAVLRDKTGRACGSLQSSPAAVPAVFVRARADWGDPTKNPRNRRFLMAQFDKFKQCCRDTIAAHDPSAGGALDVPLGQSTHATTCAACDTRITLVYENYSDEAIGGDGPVISLVDVR